MEMLMSTVIPMYLEEGRYRALMFVQLRRNHLSLIDADVAPNLPPISMIHNTQFSGQQTVEHREALFKLCHGPEAEDCELAVQYLVLGLVWV